MMETENQHDAGTYGRLLVVWNFQIFLKQLVTIRKSEDTWSVNV